MDLFRIWLAALCLTLSLIAAAAPAPETSERVDVSPFVSEDVSSTIPDALRDSEVVSQQCCKVCRKGKACGNSCISRSYNCTKPPGCACDG